ncbi:hypothetical protein BDB01DRAFT_291415 [Pilobolus umbonatus]|nr:hypothetical protein BDB01DRAFT_291415 [Pilobolus umbonatus]
MRIDSNNRCNHNSISNHNSNSNSNNRAATTAQQQQRLHQQRLQQQQQFKPNEMIDNPTNQAIKSSPSNEPFDYSSPEHISFKSPLSDISHSSPFNSPNSVNFHTENLYNFTLDDRIFTDNSYAFYPSVSGSMKHSNLLDQSFKDTIGIDQMIFPQLKTQYTDEDKLPIEPLKKPDHPPQQKKSAHNAIERRYRNNINDRISELKNAVPALVHAKVIKSGTKRSRTEDEDDDGEDGEEYLDGVAVANKLNKATILRKATEYIFHLKRTGNELTQENAILQQLIIQLPGGQELLNQYHMQKYQREQRQEMQRMEERAMEKTRMKTRKRSKKRMQDFSDHESFSSSSSDSPKKGGETTNRIFMAVFMAISLFSSSPLSAGPSSKDQFESHHHISRTADMNSSLDDTPNSESLLSSLFPFSDKWSAFRTSIFLFCLIQLFFPLIKYWICSKFKIKRVKKFRTGTNKVSSLNANMTSTVTSLTPGDQKCMQIYHILVKSLETDSPSRRSVLPAKPYLIMKEVARFVSRHWLGYEILYDDQDCTPQEHWVQTCKWIKLNEVECLGGNANITRMGMLFSCFRMLNLIETMEEDENEYVEQSRSRVYATAALQMALVVSHHGLAEMLALYFWRLAMYESGLEDDYLMRALTFDCHEDNGEDRIEGMLRSRAWSETLEVMNQQIAHFGDQDSSHMRGLSLSMTAPVLMPVGILSTLHLLDNLQTQFGRLIISITAMPLTSPGAESSDFNETAFAQILNITDPVDNSERMDDYHRLAHWLSAVGATVEALWKSDLTTAERMTKILTEKVPRSLVSRELTGGGDRELFTHKERLYQLDELIKKNIIHTLLGAALLKKQIKEKQRQGLDELWKAEKIRMEMKKMVNVKKTLEDEEEDLESSVLVLAEFVTAVTGLEAWITAWRLGDHEQGDVTKQVQNATLNLRRMIRKHSLNGLRTNKAIIDRLARLGSYVTTTESDSACECSDEEDDDSTEVRIRRSDKALKILRGLV